MAPASAGAEAPSDPMAVAYPSPPPPVVKRRSRKRLIAITAIVVILLLVVGLAGLLALRPAPVLSLTPSTVAAGDSVRVTASHLPANQNGEIRLHSTPQAFPFRADSQGTVSQTITVPQDEGIGDHTIQVCWSSACRITAILHVFEPVAPPTPSPSPSSTPGATPGTSPTPTPRSTPTSTATPSVAVAGISQTKGFTAVLNNTGGGSWSIFVYGVALKQSLYAGTASVPSGNTSYSQHFGTPIGIAVGTKAYVVACSASTGRCYGSNIVTVEL
jgi:hypothetical protein